MKSKRLKPRRPLRVVLRFTAEVFIIFLGITISFLFDQWREERKKSKALMELSQSLLMDIDGLKSRLKNDLGGSTNWIKQLDSLRIQRSTNQFSERQLTWFHKLITGQFVFLFEPHSPTYLSAANSDLYNEMPESIKNKLYDLYQVRLPFFQLLYDQQQENITNFRQTVVIPADANIYRTGSAQTDIDFQKLSLEIRRPAYGNFITQVIITEEDVYEMNESYAEPLRVLEESLREYIEKLK